MKNNCRNIRKYRTKRYITLLAVFLILVVYACASEEPPKRDVAGRGFDPQLHQSHSIDVSSDPTISMLEAKLDKDNPDPDLLLEIASRYLDLRSTEQARETIKKALDIKPDDSRFAIVLANSYADEGRFAEAEEVFSSLIAEEPENYDALVSWGVMYYNKSMRTRELDNLDRAIDIFEKAIDIDESNHKAFYNLGLIYQIQDDDQSAVKNFENVLAIKPDMINAILHLSRIESARGNRESSYKYATRGLEINPEEPELVFILGQVAFEKGDYETAEEHFTRFLTMKYVGPLESIARARLLEMKGIGR